MAFLAEANCLAAPAPAFVAIAQTNFDDEALQVRLNLVSLLHETWERRLILTFEALYVLLVCRYPEVR